MLLPTCQAARSAESLEGRHFRSDNNNDVKMHPDQFTRQIPNHQNLNSNYPFADRGAFICFIRPKLFGQFTAHLEGTKINRFKDVFVQLLGFWTIKRKSGSKNRCLDMIQAEERSISYLISMKASARPWTPNPIGRCLTLLTWA